MEKLCVDELKSESDSEGISIRKKYEFERIGISRLVSRLCLVLFQLLLNKSELKMHLIHSLPTRPPCPLCSSVCVCFRRSFTQLNLTIA